MVAIVGYHLSHEQFPPSLLLKLAQRAEQAGFQAFLNSDHFHPWTPEQGQSGFAWSFMGAALASTSLPIGVVNAPGQRYHPAIIAQALATLAEMFPDRVWAALGSGQYLNEVITGQPWPTKADRNARLLESVEVMRALFRGETVTHRGHVTVRDATLYTRPAKAPLLVGAAVTAESAKWVGSWADGLITVSRPHEELRKVVEAFREGGGAGKPMFLKVQLSYAREERTAWEGARSQWAGDVFPNPVLTDLSLPSQFAALASETSDETLGEMIRISSDPARHAEWLHADRELGFDRLFLHNVNREQEAFIEDFGTRVLPRLVGKS